MIRKSVELVRGQFLTKLFGRFVVGGVWGFVFQFVVTKGSTYFFGVSYFLPYIISTLATTIFNFFVAMKYIYRLGGKHHVIFVKYLISVIVFYFLNVVMVEGFRRYIPALIPAPNDWIIPFVLTTGIMLMLKFLIYNKFVFYDHEKPKNS